MKYMKTFIVSLLLVLIFMPLSAQVFTQINEIAAPISATGSSNMATAADAWALLINPAGLSRLEGIEVVSGFCKPYGLSFYSSQNRSNIQSSCFYSIVSILSRPI